MSLPEDGVDVALRVGHLADSTLIATPIGFVRRVLAASPFYLESRGHPARPADLTAHRCVGVQGFTGSSFWSFSDEPEIEIHYRLIVNSTDAACEAAKRGLGIISVFSHHIAAALKDGSLVPVLSEFERPALPLNLVRAAGGHLPLKLRALIDYVAPRLRGALAHDLQGVPW